MYVYIEFICSSSLVSLIFPHKKLAHVTNTCIVIKAFSVLLIKSITPQVLKLGLGEGGAHYLGLGEGGAHSLQNTFTPTNTPSGHGSFLA